MNLKFDVIIPVYKPDECLYELIRKLNAQTCKPERILLINTEEAYFQALPGSEHLTEEFPTVSVVHIKKEQFDHGATRRFGVAMTDCPYFVMMTQDAIPADDMLFEQLLNAFREPLAKLPETADGRLTAQPQVAVAYARQLADEKSGVLEKISRDFNYPAASCVKTLADLPQLGIKTFFCSDVCAMYRREFYEAQGGFVERAIFNEDMIYAHSAISAGYAIAYVAEAKVVHSHNYTNCQQFHRNFDLGVSQAQHPEVFAGVKSESEGKKLVKTANRKLLREGKWYLLPHFYMQCVSKYAGYLLGKNYRSLPKKIVLKCTTNPNYFAEKN